MREDWIEYENMCKIVKIAVSKEKLIRCNELYERLETQEEEKNV